MVASSFTLRLWNERKLLSGQVNQQHGAGRILGNYGLLQVNSTNLPALVGGIPTAADLVHAYVAFKVSTGSRLNMQQDRDWQSKVSQSQPKELIP